MLDGRALAAEHGEGEHTAHQQRWRRTGPARVSFWMRVCFMVTTPLLKRSARQGGRARRKKNGRRPETASPGQKCNYPQASYGGIIRIRLWVEGDSFLSACPHKLPRGLQFFRLYYNPAARAASSLTDGLQPCRRFCRKASSVIDVQCNDILVITIEQSIKGEPLHWPERIPAGIPQDTPRRFGLSPLGAAHLAACHLPLWLEIPFLQSGWSNSLRHPPANRILPRIPTQTMTGFWSLVFL